MEIEKVIIIGSGPAGLSAAIYASRGDLNPLVISGRAAGGQLMLTTNVDDFPGFPEGIQGPILMDSMRKQAERFKTRFLEEDVISVDFKSSPFIVKTETKQLKARTVIIATGASAMWLGLPSEQRLIGKGVSACAVCVTPDTEIIGNPSVQAINKISEQDKVLTHKGRFRRSLVTGSRQYQGDLVVINPSFFQGSLKLTPEHEVLAAKRIKGYYYRKFLLRKNVDSANQFKQLGLMPDWIPANYLTKGDFLFYPVLSQTQDKDMISPKEYVDGIVCEDEYLKNSKETHTAVRIPCNIKVDKDFLRLCGYYIAEGSGGKQLNIYFNKNEYEYIEDVKYLIKKVFGLNSHIRCKGSVTTVECFSKLVGNLFKNIFGGSASEKHLPQWMLFLPLDKQKELVKGLWRGDGSIKRQGFHYVTTSKLLSEQLKMILLKIGIIPHIYVKSIEHQNRDGHKINGRVITAKHSKYEIEIIGPWLQKMSNYLGVSHPLLEKKIRTNYFGWFQDGYAVLPIRDIKREKYNGLVYNLTIGIDNSYTTTNACVHNCDGFFFKDKEILVIGGGDSAMREAQHLSKFGKTVTIVHRRGSFRAQPALIDMVKKLPNVKFLFNKTVKEILGKEKVNGVVLKDTVTGEETKMSVDGVFIAIGHKPNTDFLKGQIELDEKGYIVAKGDTQTSVKGVFFAGDVADKKYKQAVTAAGMGVKATLDCEDYLSCLA